MPIIEVTLLKAESVTFSSGKKIVTFEKNKTKGVSEGKDGEWIMEKVKNFNQAISGAFTIEAEVDAGKLSKGWKKLSKKRLIDIAKGFGISNADDPEHFPSKDSIIAALQEQVDEGVLEEA